MCQSNGAFQGCWNIDCEDCPYCTIAKTLEEALEMIEEPRMNAGAACDFWITGIEIKAKDLYGTEKTIFRRKFWKLRQRFFQTRAGKGLQSAVYRLYLKYPNCKALERALEHLLPF